MFVTLRSFCFYSKVYFSSSISDKHIFWVCRICFGRDSGNHCWLVMAEETTKYPTDESNSL